MIITLCLYEARAGTVHGDQYRRRVARSGGFIFARLNRSVLGGAANAMDDVDLNWRSPSH